MTTAESCLGLGVLALQHPLCCATAVSACRLSAAHTATAGLTHPEVDARRPLLLSKFGGAPPAARLQDVKHLMACTLSDKQL